MFDLIQIAFFGGAVGILCCLIPGVGMLVAIAMLYPILLGLQPVELLMFYTIELLIFLYNRTYLFSIQ